MPQLPVSGGERNGTLPALRHTGSIRSWTSSSARLNGRSDQKATIEVLRGEARHALATHGHIGALLRYAT